MAKFQVFGATTKAVSQREKTIWPLHAAPRQRA